MNQEIIIKHSSLLTRINYDFDSEELTVFFTPKYYADKLTYINVPLIMFEALLYSESYGKFFLTNIKKQFKLKTMGNEVKNLPKGINNASDKKRFITGSINLKEVKKEWLTEGKDGNIYLNFTLQMLPDGELDRFENLGMVTQNVPAEIYKAEKDLPKAQKTMGPILGNMRENVWEGGGNMEALSADKLPGASNEAIDDLPF